MDFMRRKNIKVSRGYTYNFYTLQPRDEGKPTVLFLHGWPDSAELWHTIIRSYIRKGGYGAVAVDCLGYAGTSKPTNPEDYSWDLMTQDICEILNSVNLTKVVVTGHDWGSVFAARFYNFHPERVLGLAILNVAYGPPTGNTFDLENLLLTSKQKLGYSFFEYWTLFTASDGAQVCQEHASKLFDVIHGTKDTIMNTSCAPNGIRTALLNDTTYPIEDYANPVKNPSAKAMKEQFVARIEQDGFEGPMQYYYAAVNNIQSKAEAKVIGNQIIKVPTLYIAANEDVVCLALFIEPVRPLIPNLEVVPIQAGHWCMLKKPHEVGMALIYWLEKNQERF